MMRVKIIFAQIEFIINVSEMSGDIVPYKVNDNQTIGNLVEMIELVNVGKSVAALIYPDINDPILKYDEALSSQKFRDKPVILTVVLSEILFVPIHLYEAIWRGNFYLDPDDITGLYVQNEFEINPAKTYIHIRNSILDQCHHFVSAQWNTVFLYYVEKNFYDDDQQITYYGYAENGQTLIQHGFDPQEHQLKIFVLKTEGFITAKQFETYIMIQKYEDRIVTFV